MALVKRRNRDQRSWNQYRYVLVLILLLHTVLGFPNEPQGSSSSISPISSGHALDSDKVQIPPPKEIPEFKHNEDSEKQALREQILARTLKHYVDRVNRFFRYRAKLICLQKQQFRSKCKVNPTQKFFVLRGKEKISLEEYIYGRHGRIPPKEETPEVKYKEDHQEIPPQEETPEFKYKEDHQEIPLQEGTPEVKYNEDRQKILQEEIPELKNNEILKKRDLLREKLIPLQEEIPGFEPEAGRTKRFVGLGKKIVRKAVSFSFKALIFNLLLKRIRQVLIPVNYPSYEHEHKKRNQNSQIGISKTDDLHTAGSTDSSTTENLVDEIPVFNANQVSLDLPGAVFGPTFSILNGASRIMGLLVRNAAVRIARLFDAALTPANLVVKPTTKKRGADFNEIKFSNGTEPVLSESETKTEEKFSNNTQSAFYHSKIEAKKTEVKNFFDNTLPTLNKSEKNELLEETPNMNRYVAMRY